MHANAREVPRLPAQLAARVTFTVVKAYLVSFHGSKWFNTLEPYLVSFYYSKLRLIESAERWKSTARCARAPEAEESLGSSG